MFHFDNHIIARGKVTPTGSKLEGGPSSEASIGESLRDKEKEREERKAAKKLKKELQNVEAQAVPLGPLVALGKPRDKLKKRPRCDFVIRYFIPSSLFVPTTIIVFKSVNLLSLIMNGMQLREISLCMREDIKLIMPCQQL